MTNLDAALEPVRQMLARRAAERGTRLAAERAEVTSASDPIKALAGTARALSDPAHAGNGNGNGTASAGPTPSDWAVFDQNQVDIQEIVKKLRRAGH